MATKAEGEKKAKRGGKVKIFFKGVWSELKKVHWPDRKTLITYTGIVVVTVIIMSLAISGLDWIFTTFVKLILGLA